MNQLIKDSCEIAYLMECIDELLCSGDSTGCDALIVVDLVAYHGLRTQYHAVTGKWRGEEDNRTRNLFPAA